MPVTLTIKQVPDQIAESLRKLAAQHHRSLQGELMSIIEQVVLAHNAGNTAQGFQSKVQELTATPYVALTGNAPTAESDGLLTDLDAIVAGSEWGKAPLLTRTQANDRTLGKEFHYLATENQTKNQTK